MGYVVLEYRNRFHGSVARVHCPPNRVRREGLEVEADLTHRQLAQLAKQLCGRHDCQCGGTGDHWSFECWRDTAGHGGEVIVGGRIVRGIDR